MITFCIVVGWAWVERPSIPRTTVAKHYLFIYFFERAARKLLQSFIRRKRKNKNKNNFTINQPAVGSLLANETNTTRNRKTKKISKICKKIFCSVDTELNVRNLSAHWSSVTTTHLLKSSSTVMPASLPPHKFVSQTEPSIHSWKTSLAMSRDDTSPPTFPVSFSILEILFHQGLPKLPLWYRHKPASSSLGEAQRLVRRRWPSPQVAASALGSRCSTEAEIEGGSARRGASDAHN